MARQKKAKKGEPVACDHEVTEWASHQGSTIWACQCGKEQFVSSKLIDGGKLIPLDGKQRIAEEGIRRGWTKVEIPAPETPKAAAPVQLNSDSNEHYTPAEYIEAARSLMGNIDLDPASCEQANLLVKAQQFLSKEHDGLRYEWHGNVFLNPPGGYMHGETGKRVKMSQAAVWWAKLCQEWLAGRTKQAVFIGFTLEILRTSQQTQLPVQCFHRCYPKDRICFGGKDDPTHANVIAYLPSMRDDTTVWLESFAQFRVAFSKFGYCEPGCTVPVDTYRIGC